MTMCRAGEGGGNAGSWEGGGLPLRRRAGGGEGSSARPPAPPLCPDRPPRTSLEEMKEDGQILAGDRIREDRRGELIKSKEAKTKEKVFSSMWCSSISACYPQRNLIGFDWQHKLCHWVCWMHVQTRAPAPGFSGTMSLSQSPAFPTAVVRRRMLRHGWPSLLQCFSTRLHRDLLNLHRRY